MRIGSLFSGIGGLEMGLESCGLGPVIWQAERDPYCLRVLAKHWPNVRRYNDVRAIDEAAERPDLICGGSPCQDISSAGKLAGIEGERSGLWSEYARIVRILRPRFVFIENVAALAVRGLDRVLADLASLGFDAEWDTLGACCVGAPHRRERMWVLARNADRESESNGPVDAQASGVRGLASDAAISRREAWGADGSGSGDGGRVPGVTHGGWWSAEPNVGRVADGIPDRSHRLRALGNAVVPQQAAAAFRILADRAAGVGCFA